MTSSCNRSAGPCVSLQSWSDVWWWHTSSVVAMWTRSGRVMLLAPLSPALQDLVLACAPWWEPVLLHPSAFHTGDLQFICATMSPNPYGVQNKHYPIFEDPWPLTLYMLLISKVQQPCATNPVLSRVWCGGGCLIKILWMVNCKVCCGDVRSMRGSGCYLMLLRHREGSHVPHAMTTMKKVTCVLNPSQNCFCRVEWLLQW